MARSDTAPCTSAQTAASTEAEREIVRQQPGEQSPVVDAVDEDPDKKFGHTAQDPPKFVPLVKIVSGMPGKTRKRGKGEEAGDRLASHPAPATAMGRAAEIADRQ